MIHPDTEVRYISPAIGYGLVATKLIPRGTITWALDSLDRTFSPAEVAALEPPYQELLETYAYRNHQGHWVLCWDNARFVNHSFRANCLSTAYDFELAVRDILPGEQLTDDYGYLNVSEPFRASPEGTKRKTVYPDDLLRYYRSWDNKLHRAFKNLNKVAQPLEAWLSARQRKNIEDVLRGGKVPDSILNLYYQPKHQLGQQSATQLG